MSDFGALHDTLKGLAAGDDMETGTTTIYDGALLAAVQSGQASLALVERRGAADPHLDVPHRRVRHRLHPDVDPGRRPPARWRARSSAKAITLLKNSGHVLPLTARRTKSIAVIGADANILAAESGSAYVDPDHVDADPAGHHRPGRRRRQGHASRRATTRSTRASMIETADMTTVPSSVLTPASGTGPGPDRPVLAHAQLHRPARRHPRRAAGQLRRRLRQHLPGLDRRRHPGAAPAVRTSSSSSRRCAYDGFLIRTGDRRLRAVADRLGRRHAQPGRHHDHRHDRPGRPPGRRLAGAPPGRRASGTPCTSTTARPAR